MEHQFFDIFFVYFLGPFLLFGLKWMLNSILNIFLPHPESLSAPKKIQPEIKLPLWSTKEGTSCLQKHGFLPDGNKSTNNLDEIINERQAILMTTELEKIKPCAHAHVDQKSHLKQDKQLESDADEAKCELKELKKTFSKEMVELKALMKDDQAALKLAEERQRELEDMLEKATQKSEAFRTEMSHALANQEALYEEREKQLKLVAELAKRQLKEVRKTNQEQVMELKDANYTKEAALKFAEGRQRELEDMLGKATEEADALRTEMSHALENQKALHEEREKQLKLVAEQAGRQLREVRQTTQEEITELKVAIHTNEAAMKLAEGRQRESEDMLGKATQEAEALRTEMSHAIANQEALYEEREKQLKLVAEQAKRPLKEVRKTNQEQVMELKVANWTKDAALKFAEGRQRDLEDMLGKATEKADALRTEMSHALANQKALYEEREKQLKLVAEQAKRQLKEVRKTNQEQVMVLKVANWTKEAALKFAEGRQRDLEDMLGKATEKADALRTEMSHALANQKALYEEREKQLKLVAEQAKCPLMEVRKTNQEQVMVLKVANWNKEAALKFAEGRQRDLEEMLGKATEKADALRTEMSHALANQKALYEEREKQFKLVAEQAKRPLMEVRQINQGVWTIAPFN